MKLARRVSILLFSVVLLGAPSQAFALRLTPPGKSGSDQYFETIPTSAGNAAPPQGGGSGSGAGGALSHLSQGRAGSKGLAHLGKDGQAAASLAAATAPTNGAAGGTAGGTAGGSSAGSHGLNSVQGESTSRGIADALTGSDTGGIGLVLPLLLGTSLIMAIGLAAWRLRRGSGPPELSV
jgi:hypothetical protein